MKKLQNGFAVIEGLLILVIVGIIGGVSWYVWHSNKVSNDNLSQADKTASQTVAASSKKTTPAIKSSKDAGPIVKGAPPAAPKKYLTIKEWKVKFTLSAGIYDAVYRTDSFDPGYAFLSTKSLKGTSCDISNNGGGYYFRYKSGQFDSESKRYYSDIYKDSVHLGSYYYAFRDSNYVSDTTCSSDSSVQKKADEAANEFKQAVKTVQPVN